MESLIATTVQPAPAVRRSKRARPEVSYAELDEAEAVNGMDLDYSSNDELHAPSHKKRKTKAARIVPFRFLDLPAELRNHIYALALVDDDGFMLSSATIRFRRSVKRSVLFQPDQTLVDQLHPVPESPGDKKDSSSVTPQLLATCKQIRDEALPMLYSQRIMLADTVTLHSFLATIGPQNLKHLTKLVVKQWGEGRGAHKAANHYAFTALQDATNLQEICLDCQLGWYSGEPKRVAMKVYRAACYFLERYRGLHGLESALDVIKLNRTIFDRPSYSWGRRNTDDLENLSVGEKMGMYRTELARLLDGH